MDTWLGGDLSLLNQLKSYWFWHTNNPKYKKTRVYRVAVSKIWMYGDKTEIQFQWKLDAVSWGGAHHQIIISISTSLYNCLIISALWVNFILFTIYIVVFKPLKKKWFLFHHFWRGAISSRLTLRIFRYFQGGSRWLQITCLEWKPREVVGVPTEYLTNFSARTRRLKLKTEGWGNTSADK